MLDREVLFAFRRYNPLGRVMLRCCLFGAALAVIVIPIAALRGYSLLEQFLLLTILVIVPLALAQRTNVLEARGEPLLLEASIRMYPIGALAACCGMLLLSIGPVSALLAVPWVLSVGLASLDGLTRFLRRGFAAPEELAIDLGLMYLPMAGFWFVSYRLGVQPLGVPSLIVLLAGVHFANAGFTALFLTGLSARWLAARHDGLGRSLLIYSTITGLACPLAVAFAIAYSWRDLEVVSGFAMESGYLVLCGVILWRIVPHVATRLAQALLAVCAIGLLVGMCFAASYTLKILDIPQMVSSHGYIMSLVVCLCGLLGWYLIGPVRARRTLSDTHFLENIREMAFFFYGIFVGQMALVVAVVYVWKAEPPAQFLAWFGSNLPGMTLVLEPLGALALGLSLLSMCLSGRNPGQWLYIMAAAACLIVSLATYPIFFATLDERLATPGSTPVTQVASALDSWGWWHWARLLLAAAGLCLLARGLVSIPTTARALDRRQIWAAPLSMLATVAFAALAGELVMTSLLAATWQKMTPPDFLAWFSLASPYTNAVMVPTAVAGGLLVLPAFAASVGVRPPTRGPWLGLAVLCWVGIVAMNPLFFTAANHQFLTPGQLTPAAATTLLDQWVQANELRLLLALGGLYAALRSTRPDVVPGGATAWEQWLADHGRIGLVESTGNAYQTVREARQKLQGLETALLATRDRRGIFAMSYAATIVELEKYIEAGAFHDGQWVSRFAVALANRYRSALAGFENGRRDAVPECWRVSFEAAIRRQCIVTQDLLLGLNAHIQYDHVAALFDVGIAADAHDRVYEDYVRINDALDASTDPVTRRAARLYAPGFGMVRGIFGPSERSMAGGDIRKTREAAWQRAMVIVAAKPEDRARLLQGLDEEIAATALRISTFTAQHAATAKMMAMVENSAAMELPPGKLGLPWLGQSLQFARDPAGTLRGLCERYGPVFKLRLLGNNLICVIGSQAFTLLTDESRFCRERANPRQWRELMDWECSPLIDGARRLRRKRLLLQAFVPDALADYRVIIDQVLASYLARWEQLGIFGWTQELKTYSWAVADSVYLGSNPGLRRVADTVLIERCQTGMRSIPINLPFTPFGKALRARDQLIARISGSAAFHREKPHPDLMQRLLGASDNEGGLTLEEIQMEGVQLFYASYGAMHAVLSCLLVALNQYPAVYERARQEVLAKAPQGAISIDALNDMEYVDWVTREVRRFYPLVATTLFAGIKQNTTYAGYLLPAGWKVIGGIAATLLDAHTFENPTQFDPERFSPARRAKLKPNSWVPHGGGEPEGHRCAGEQLANLHLRLFAARLLRDYQWTFPEQDLTLNPSKGIPEFRDGLQVRFTRR